MKSTYFRKCAICGNDFKTAYWNQKYCSDKCKLIAKANNERLYRASLPESTSTAHDQVTRRDTLVCNCTACAFYSEKRKNHCDALSETYEPCHFFKTKEQLKEEEAMRVERESKDSAYKEAREEYMRWASQWSVIAK